MPAARHRSRSRASTFAVSATIGVDGDAATPLVAADRRGRRVTVHAGHLAIHEDDVEALPLRLGHGGVPVAHEHRTAAEDLEHRDRHLAIDGVVVRDQHAQAERGRAAGLRRRLVLGAGAAGAAAGVRGCRDAARALRSCCWRTGLPMLASGAMARPPSNEGSKASALSSTT